MLDASLIEFGVSNALIVMAVLITVPVLMGVYVYRDAGRRNMNAAIWTLIALFAPLFTGFIVYLLVRRKAEATEYR
jgi:ABC-type tungstate transport system substrate-binding protein